MLGRAWVPLQSASDPPPPPPPPGQIHPMLPFSSCNVAVPTAATIYKDDSCGSLSMQVLPVHNLKEGILSLCPSSSLSRLCMWMAVHVLCPSSSFSRQCMWMAVPSPSSFSRLCMWMTVLLHLWRWRGENLNISHAAGQLHQYLW